MAQAATRGAVAARGESASGAFELVAIAQGAEILIYLDAFATNTPIRDATIAAETPDGAKSARAEGDIYKLDAPFLAKGGIHDLIFTITAADAVDILPLTLETMAASAARNGGEAGWRDRIAAYAQPATLAAGAGGFLIGIALMAWGRRRTAASIALLGLLALVGDPASAHDGDDHGEQKPLAASTGSDAAQRLTDGTLFIPKPVQRIFDVRTALTAMGAFGRSVELPGRVIPDPNASGYVQASVGGRLSAPPGGFPQLGTPVKEGDVLAYVTPPLQAIDVSDMSQRQGELDQQISITERRLARFEQLAPSGAVARSQVEDARLELQGLRERRSSLDKARRQPEALTAPVAGVIAEGTPVAGQITQPNAVVFHIVDPSKLWIEALSFAAVPASATASASTANGKTLSLGYRGAGFSDRNQTVPVHFAIDSDPAGLRSGQFVTVLVSTPERRQGVALPRGALVRRANGQDVIYEHTGPERFTARPVRTEPLDGDRILILTGIDPGRRIVVQGAELLDQVR